MGNSLRFVDHEWLSHLFPNARGKVLLGCTRKRVSGFSVLPLAGQLLFLELDPSTVAFLLQMFGGDSCNLL